MQQAIELLALGFKEVEPRDGVEREFELYNEMIMINGARAYSFISNNSFEDIVPVAKYNIEIMEKYISILSGFTKTSLGLYKHGDIVISLNRSVYIFTGTEGHEFDFFETEEVENVLNAMARKCRKN